MRKLFFAAAAFFLASNVGFSQTVTQIIRQDGTVENVQIRTFDTTPKTIRIQPYGLNLQPAKTPERSVPRSSASYNPTPYNPGPIVIENPFYKEPEPTGLELFFRSIGLWVSKLTQ